MLQVEEYGQVFMEHANKLVEVANLACSMSSNEEGVKLVRLAATQLETLCPQVRVTAVCISSRGGEGGVTEQFFCCHHLYCACLRMQYTLKFTKVYVPYVHTRYVNIYIWSRGHCITETANTIVIPHAITEKFTNIHD